MAKTIILLAIAGGLWANALAPLVMSRAANAQGDMSANLLTIINNLELIHHDIEKLAAGICTNPKLCGR
jgi:hypothetical protein